MTRANTLEEAVRLVADGERVLVTISGIEIGMIPADEIADIEAMEDRYWNKKADEALAEPGEAISLDDYLKSRAAQQARNRATPRRRRARAERS